MQLSLLINLIANTILTVSISMFMIFVYGRSSKIDHLPLFERVIIKAALAMTASGAFFNVLTFADPSFSEILFNTGLAIVFAWAAWFHFKYFVKK